VPFVRRHRRVLRGCLWPYVGWIGSHTDASCSLLNDCHPRAVNAYHCGQRIEEGRVVLRVETGPARDRLPMVDLCPACFERFAAWLGQGLERKAPAAPTPG
jgi:hypothetical protein